MKVEIHEDYPGELEEKRHLLIGRLQSNPSTACHCGCGDIAKAVTKKPLRKTLIPTKEQSPFRVVRELEARSHRAGKVVSSRIVADVVDYLTTNR